EAPRLRELARGAATVAVAIPDASRPCPSPAILEHLLEELRGSGVPDDGITVVVGCGLHRTTSAAEREGLAGTAPARRVRTEDAQGLETPCADLGLTSSGAPVHIARRVAEADLAVTVGVVEPHLYAGFSGGVKGVAIGCAGHQTIAWTHRPAFVSAPGVAVGGLAGNLFHDTLVEIAARTPLAWGVNVVMNERGEAAAVAAGDPTAAQAALARAHAGAWLRSVDGPFDVVVAGVHAPKSHNLYQASRAATYIGLAGRPALADGGLLVLCADLPGGAGDGPGERNFAAVLAAAASPAELVARGLREPLGPGGQRAFVVARVLERFRIGVVGAAAPGLLEPLGVAAFDCVDAAVAAAEVRLGRRARVLAVADAMATVVSSR
ncbi:MAG: lactate racemase domain-containing protein, partial [Actinobacteria bacterium]|nr:lactate racemase domain-containing protein [Actinomycetota bacterium]